MVPVGEGPADSTVFKRIALARVRDAEALLAARNYSGAFHFAGVGVECALKAIICKRHRLHKLDAAGLDAFKKDFFTHDLGKLLALSKLEPDLFASSTRAAYWNLILTWKVDTRYSHHIKPRTAKQFLEAVSTGPDSFIEWLGGLW